jgi:hypothetical protein
LVPGHYLSEFEFLKHCGKIHMMHGFFTVEIILLYLRGRSWADRAFAAIRTGLWESLGFKREQAIATGADHDISSPGHGATSTVGH